MKLQKVGRSILFVAFFLCLHFFLRFWALGMHTLLIVCNYGGPFGIMLPVWFFIPVLCGVTVFLVVQWWKEESFSSEWPWLLVLAGGAGNLSEHFFFGCITDYVALSFFPVFNLADIFLTIGVVGVLWFARKNCRL